MLIRRSLFDRPWPWCLWQIARTRYKAFMKTHPSAFKLGGHRVKGDLILAPMDGISDLPTRSLCREFGSAISYTGFINAIEILQRNASAWKELTFLDSERPVVIQLFDSDEDRLLRAAELVCSLRPDAIDVNMGCSDRRVSGRGAGAGLLRDPKKAGRLIGRLSSALPIPITAKIRLGWDSKTVNYLEIADAIQSNGGALIAVHARTRQQGYRGLADWQAIAAIKAAARVPVIGNGDVHSLQSAQEMRRQTGCDAVMIGRAAIGNPWLFQGLAPSEITLEMRARTVHDHLRRMLAFHGPQTGLLRFRKHLSRYLAPLDLDEHTRRALLTAGHPSDVQRLLAGLGMPAPDHLPAFSFIVPTPPPRAPDGRRGIMAPASE